MCCGALCHHDHLVLSVGDMYFDGASRGWEGGDCPNNEKWSATDACLSFFTAENRDIWGKNGRRGIHVGRCEGICIFMHFRPSNCGNKRYMCFKVLQTSDNEAIIFFMFKLIYHLYTSQMSSGCTNKIITMMLNARKRRQTIIFCSVSSDNPNSDISERILIFWSMLWYLSTIAQILKELRLSFVSMCLKKVWNEISLYQFFVCLTLEPYKPFDLDNIFETSSNVSFAGASVNINWWPFVFLHLDLEPSLCISTIVITALFLLSFSWSLHHLANKQI